MADIRTRQVNKGTIKSIDRAANLSGHVRTAGVRTKEDLRGLSDTDGRNESAYAGDNTMHMASRSVRGTSRAVISGSRKVKGAISEKQNIIDVKTKYRMVHREGEVAPKGAAPSRVASGRRAKGNSAARRRRIKTAGRVSAIRKTQQAKKLEQARQAQVATRRTAERTARESKRMAILSYHALRRVIGSSKAAMLMLGSGAWISMLVITVIVFFGAAFYFFGDESSSNYTPVSPEVEAYTPIIQKYAKEYGIPEYVDLIKAVMMQESGGRGKDPMQAAEGAFNTKYPKVPNGIKDPDYSIRCGVQELKAALESAKVENPLDMDRIRLALQGYNYGNGYIPWAIKRDGGYTVENAAVFSDEQAKKHGWKSYGDKQYVAHVLRYYPYGNYNMGIGNTKITQVASQQIGNKGGKKFWSWYGFNGRVEWCACYVNWCADQCGYIKAGVFPKFASCQVGVSWFKEKKQWQPRGRYTPMPGDIIFFDWGCNGGYDHVGIVEKCDGKTVYTIEGNTSDQCARRQYSIQDPQILGYGVPKY